MVAFKFKSILYKTINQALRSRKQCVMDVTKVVCKHHIYIWTTASFLNLIILATNLHSKAKEELWSIFLEVHHMWNLKIEIKNMCQFVLSPIIWLKSIPYKGESVVYMYGIISSLLSHDSISESDNSPPIFVVKRSKWYVAIFTKHNHQVLQCL